jgi:hypothetical protein
MRRVADPLYAGCLFILLAVALIVTACQARAAQGDIAFLVEGMGWATVAAAAWLITAPRSYQRLSNAFWDAEGDVSYSYTINVDSTNTVPKPASLAIFGIGALGPVAGGIRRRKRSA